MQSIEIEKKVRLEPHHIRQIEENGQLLKESKIQDHYFDTEDFRFTTQNIWIRKRDDVFELKVHIKSQDCSVDRYEEITDKKRILEVLGVKSDLPLSLALSENEIHPFLSFYTHRKSYQLNDLKIDIDIADFGDLIYQVAEIELVVSDLNDIQNAENRIFQFAHEMGIDISAHIPAKISHYLYHKRPNHYQTLVQHNVIRPLVV